MDGVPFKNIDRGPDSTIAGIRSLNRTRTPPKNSDPVLDVNPKARTPDWQTVMPFRTNVPAIADWWRPSVVKPGGTVRGT